MYADKFDNTEQIINNLRNVMIGAVRLLIVPVETLIRRAYGERYYMPFLVLFLFFVFNFISFGVYGLSTQKDLGYLESNSLVIFTYLFAIAGVFHYISIWNRRRKNVRMHSRFIGKALPFLYFLPNADGMTVYRFIEPLFILLVAFIFSFFDPLFSGYLAISSFGLAFVAHAQWKRFHNQILDAIDAEIESTNLSAAMAGKSVDETEGFFIAGLKNMSNTEKAQVAERFRQKNKADEAKKSAIVNPFKDKEITKE